MHVPQEAITLIKKILVRNPADRPTLDDILASDFMKMGQGILRELPAVCSKKAPTKPDLSLTISYPTNSFPLAPPKQAHSAKDYVVKFEEILEDTYFYRLANDFCGVLEKGVRALYRHPDGRYLLRSLTNNY